MGNGWRKYLFFKNLCSKEKNLFWGNEDAYLKKAIAVVDEKEIVLEEDKIIKGGDEVTYPL